MVYGAPFASQRSSRYSGWDGGGNGAQMLHQKHLATNSRGPSVAPSGALEPMSGGGGGSRHSRFPSSVHGAASFFAMSNEARFSMNNGQAGMDMFGMSMGMPSGYSGIGGNNGFCATASSFVAQHGLQHSNMQSNRGPISHNSNYYANNFAPSMYPTGSVMYPYEVADVRSQYHGGPQMATYPMSRYLSVDESSGRPTSGGSSPSERPMGSLYYAATDPGDTFCSPTLPNGDHAAPTTLQSANTLPLVTEAATTEGIAHGRRKGMPLSGSPNAGRPSTRGGREKPKSRSTSRKRDSSVESDGDFRISSEYDSGRSTETIGMKLHNFLRSFRGKKTGPVHKASAATQRSTDFSGKESQGLGMCDRSSFFKSEGGMRSPRSLSYSTESFPGMKKQSKAGSMEQKCLFYSVESSSPCGPDDGRKVSAASGSQRSSLVTDAMKGVFGFTFSGEEGLLPSDSPAVAGATLAAASAAGEAGTVPAMAYSPGPEGNPAARPSWGHPAAAGVPDMVVAATESLSSNELPWDRIGAAQTGAMPPPPPAVASAHAPAGAAGDANPPHTANLVASTGAASDGAVVPHEGVIKTNRKYNQSANKHLWVAINPRTREKTPMVLSEKLVRWEISPDDESDDDELVTAPSG